MMQQDSLILVWMEQVGVKNALDAHGDMVFENLNLRIDSGEFLVISGVYGSDRISLINILGCLDKPSCGKYIFDYNDITTIDSKKRSELRSKEIGFLFKGLNIIDGLSVYKNLEIPVLSGSPEKIENLINHAAEVYGLKDILHKKARNITDLERHYTAIARAMILKPRVLIADEPGENLNMLECSKILDAISQANQAGTTVIVFSDKMELVERATRHIVFDKGNLKSDRMNIVHHVKEDVV